MEVMIMIFKRNTESVADVRKRENFEAQVAKQQADIDYLAMMSDIDIPTEEMEVTENE
jgi:hypothetical protein